MSKPSVSIQKIITKDSTEITLSEDDKVIVVGSNNSGKSQFLREIFNFTIQLNNQPYFIVDDLKLHKVGDLDDLVSYLEAEGTEDQNYYKLNNWRLNKNQIQGWNGKLLNNSLSAGFIKNIEAKERLNVCDQQNSISPEDNKSKPQHVLYQNDELMDKVSSVFREAFGKDLIIDYKGGNKIPIHVGEKPTGEAFLDRVGIEYIDYVRKSPLLDQQGDGMKSYAGILFETIVNDVDITLIDEPEAFLHPPQMRKLGATLVSEVCGQLFVATHSSDILRGFLEESKGNIKILRISRNGSLNSFFESPKDSIRKLWTQPELRYSNALEGIFHEQTIICEHDGDCKLFNSVADHLEGHSERQWLDTAYVPTGGKHAIPKVAGLLREIGVPTKAIFDIDFLSEQYLVRKTVESFGGEWKNFEQTWKCLDAAVRKGITPLNVEEIKDRIIQILKHSETDKIPKSEIDEALKSGKEWNKVKKHGESIIPNGDAQKYFNTILNDLESIGIYVIREGQIENFCKEVGSHGPKFVKKLLSDYDFNDEKLSNLLKFVKNVSKGKCCVL
jgi:ABC-type thiamine transport system ATPase subunit